MKNSNLLTLDEAAERIGVSSGYMRQLLQMGEIAHIRLGPPPAKGKMDVRRYRIDEADLDDYLERRKIAAITRGVKDLNVREWRRRSLA